MTFPVNNLAVLVAAVASFAVGALWYTVLFGKPWRKLMGIEPMPGEKMSMVPMAYGFVLMLLMVYVLAHFAVIFYPTNGFTVYNAISLAFWVWLGFQAPLLANSVLYEKRPLKLYAINAAHQLVAIVVAAIVLSLF